MNIFNVFLHTSTLVQISIFVLIIFSTISWSIIFYRTIILKIKNNKVKVFEKKFWSGVELSSLYQHVSMNRGKFNGSEKIFYIGFKEFSQLYQLHHVTPKIVISRTLHVMHIAMNTELEELERYLPLIGTIGSISPYVGLFGTVLGIIHVFIELGKTTNNFANNHIVHIQIVAPGIAEALISTAIGLFVAIPAVIAFNYLSVKINYLHQKYNNFIEEFITILHHQISLNSFNSTVKQNTQNEKTKEKIHT